MVKTLLKLREKEKLQMNYSAISILTGLSRFVH